MRQLLFNPLFIDERTGHRADNYLPMFSDLVSTEAGPNTAVWCQSPASAPLHHGAFSFKYFTGEKKTQKGNYKMFVIK